MKRSLARDHKKERVVNEGMQKWFQCKDPPHPTALKVWTCGCACPPTPYLVTLLLCIAGYPNTPTLALIVPLHTLE